MTSLKISISNDLLDFLDLHVKTARVLQDRILQNSAARIQQSPVITITHLQKYWIGERDWFAVEAKIKDDWKFYTMPILEFGEYFTIHLTVIGHCVVWLW